MAGRGFITGSHDDDDDDDDDGDCDDDDDNDEFDCHRLLLDGEEIICPDCAKEKLMGPQAQ